MPSIRYEDQVYPGCCLALNPIIGLGLTLSVAVLVDFSVIVIIGMELEEIE
jgi:hypothetical protein